MPQSAVFAHSVRAGYGQNYMRILFITPSRIGDAVISCGILEQLRLQYPKARFTIACGPLTADLFSRFPALDKLVVFEKQSFDRHWLRLWGRLFPHIWSLAVDGRSSAITLVLMARRRFILPGGRRPGRRYVQLGLAMGFNPPPLPVVWTSPADDRKAASLLEHGPFIALAPTASWEGKIWPAPRFAALFQALAARIPGARAVILGGPGETEAALAAPLLQALPGAINLVGQLTLPEVVACLRHVTLFVGNDSGLMHLAAAIGAPTLGLFGRSRASEYAPAGHNATFIEAPGPEGEAPMEGLSVEAVAASAFRLIGI